MFTPGKLFHFDPFHFNKGGSKPKFFLVLHATAEQLIIASLPSSQVHLPAACPLTHGCHEVRDSGIGCYTFEAGKPILQNGWAFPKNTFLYGG